MGHQTMHSQILIKVLFTKYFKSNIRQIVHSQIKAIEEEEERYLKLEEAEGIILKRTK